MSGSTGTPTRVPAEERVFSLVLALVASPQGLTKNELFSSVHGYSSRYRPGANDPALERQFERDKEQVRQLGIPIETLDSPLEPGNNQLTRYRVSKDLLQLPEHIRFSADELSMLRVAAMAWSEGSLSPQARWSSMKLAALGSSPQLTNMGVAPRLTIPEPAAPHLQQAIDGLRIVNFDYQLPEREAPLARTVAPLRLHRAEGRWHLIAFDKDRNSPRVFLLSRISSVVSVTQHRFDAELFEFVDETLAEMLSLEAKQRATVYAKRGSTAEARLALRGESRRSSDHHTIIEFGTLDMHALAGELAGYGDEVAVAEPDWLRGEVQRLLVQVHQQHCATRASAS